jgi:hypothetical protein
MAASKLAIALTFLLYASSVAAIDLGAPIVGCAEVDCPVLDHTTSGNCRVADRTFTTIGLANFNPPISSDDFTWTEGIQIYDNVDPNVDKDRVFEKNFYLGLPQGLNLNKSAEDSGFGACALFFTRVADAVKFRGDNPETAVGTCVEAMSQDCVDALLMQGTNAAKSFGNMSTTDACNTLLSEFGGNPPSQCSRFATRDTWQSLQVRGMSVFNHTVVAMQTIDESKQVLAAIKPQLLSPRPRTQPRTAIPHFRKATPSHVLLHST